MENVNKFEFRNWWHNISVSSWCNKWLRTNLHSIRKKTIKLDKNIRKQFEYIQAGVKGHTSPMSKYHDIEGKDFKIMSFEGKQRSSS